MHIGDLIQENWIFKETKISKTIKVELACKNFTKKLYKN